MGMAAREVQDTSCRGLGVENECIQQPLAYFLDSRVRGNDSDKSVVKSFLRYYTTEGE
jgi:hypothetical protein